MQPSDQFSIVIGIATRHRHEGLKTLLNSFEGLTTPGNIRVSVVVVDNSEDGQEKDFLEGWAQQARFETAYIHEPVTGLSHARNAALRFALDQSADYLCIIDDDEVPKQNWLKTLFETIQQTGAAAVSGAVVPRFVRQPSWWIQKGGFFSVTSYEEDTPIDFGHTSNVIIDLSVVANEALEFSPKFSLSGGEDTYFFNQLRVKGYDTMFTRLAEVEELIVAPRATFNWLMRRWFRTGNTDGLVKLLNYPGRLNRTKVMLGGALRVLIGMLQALVGMPLLLAKNELTFKGLRIASRGLGFVVASIGGQFQEYKHHNR